MTREIQIRPFAPPDAAPVRELFIQVNRLLAPAHLAEAFESYITRSLVEEMDRIADYYASRDGGFWVADDDSEIVGMFGLEAVGAEAMELRRMYVAPSARRRGIALKMLAFAEQECRRRNRLQLRLSTSGLQQDALALCRNAGFEAAREEIAETASNKTLGGGIRRYHFAKRL